MSPRIDTRVTIWMIVAWLLLAAGQFVAYGKNLQRTDELEKRLLTISTDGIRRTTVLEMFKTRDVQIAALSGDVQIIRTDVKDLIKLSQMILRTMPREREKQ